MSKNKKSKEIVTATSVWWCDTCDDKREMSHQEMVEHLKAKHGLDTKGLKCKKSMIMHLDCEVSFHSTYEVSIDTPGNELLKLTNSTSNPRHKNDPMRFA